ncbi:16S rRNA (guanine(527)-N(7))-methyltransferase RsmG [Thermospira aquatica]|uniref:Ribosomal RNA small subunit methyltransferase G n=1 Tax=Thermospira aquatica TaxID=2828656 RepID=A0AAX3BBI4_9SPIR|nr:16S rRNA (guanine(527)-N(7))-methyltransferase RsmG [Thermospira aquatica]URA09578.1 16S rRNA (guanine(527)-N(7))-methyltransferase RsmG [Thermospira aquatica]
MLTKLSSEQQNLLDVYKKELLHWNKTTNLIGRSTEASFDEEHLQNSLEIIPFLKPDLPIIDVGTGGGLPGIPLAIALPDREIVLAEVDRKKLAFLYYITAKLHLANTRVVEVLPSFVFLEPCEIVSRAYGPIERILLWTRSHAPAAKHYVILKGAQVEKELSSLHLRDLSVHTLSRGCVVCFSLNDRSD